MQGKEHVWVMPALDHGELAMDPVIGTFVCRQFDVERFRKPHVGALQVQYCLDPRGMRGVADSTHAALHQHATH